jgi:hypothetical protein
VGRRRSGGPGWSGELVGEVGPDAFVKLVGKGVSSKAHGCGNAREVATNRSSARPLLGIGRAGEASEAFIVCLADASFDDVERLMELELEHVGPPFGWLSGDEGGWRGRLHGSTGVVVADGVARVGAELQDNESADDEDENDCQHENLHGPWPPFPLTGSSSFTGYRIAACA